jgi:iron complex transport system ATP-binding protein
MNNRLAVAQRATCTIDATDLRFSYGSRTVIEGISVAAQPGEFICIVGPNGSGKSTLLKLLLGHLHPHSGTIQLNGQNLHSLPPATIARHLALVPQSGTIGFSYTVEQVVLMARWPWRSKGLAGTLGFETPHDLELTRDALAAMDITALAHRPVTELSGGERQRVLVARALTQQTPAILLDEPTSAMDIRHQLQMLAILREQVRTQNKLVICVTHDLNLAAEWADRTILMDAGRIIADGPTPTVIRPDLLEKVYGVRVQTAPAIRFTL